MTSAMVLPPAPAHPSRADPKAFEVNLASPRTLFSAALSALAFLLTLLACAPLFSVLIMLIWRGGSRLAQGGVSVFSDLPPSAMSKHGGGFGNALVGTLVMVVLASAIAVPFGILSAIFLAEYGARSRFGTAVRFAAKIMTGLPSILAGVFAYASVVALTGGFSAVAGGVALSVLMIPIVMLTAEEAIKMVPQRMKEAAVGMGGTRPRSFGRSLFPRRCPAS